MPRVQRHRVGTIVYQGPPDAVIEAAATTAAETAVDAEIAGRELVEGGRFDDDEIAAAITDQSGRMSWLATDHTGRPPSHTKSILSADLHTPAEDESDASVYSVTDDDGRRSWLEISRDGGPTPHAASLIASALAISPSSDPADTITPAQADGDRRLLLRTSDGEIRPVTSRSDIVTFWGDSLFDGYPMPPFLADDTNSLPGVFASLYPSATVSNEGKSGQTAGDIAFRQGGLVVLVAPAGGEIPASGAVTVTTSQDIRFREGYAMTVTGTLAGVAGTLTFDAGTPRVVTFTRSASGTTVPVTEPTPFLVNAPTDHADGIQVIIAGRNDVTWHTGDVVGDVVAATAAMVESLTPRFPRVLLLGTITATSETIGSANHTAILRINESLASLYPDYFWDFRRWLIDQAMDVMGITPTEADRAAIVGDTLPPSLMEDDRHYTPATAAAAAQRIYNEMQTRGWI